MKSAVSQFKTILEEELAKRADRNPRYSLRAMARALDIKPSALSEILSAKRVPSLKMAQKILSNLDLAPERETVFLDSVIHLRESKGLKVHSSLKKIKANEPKDLSIDLFRVVGDWYHYAILMLTFVEGFQSNPKWISSQLSITEIEAKLAITRLLELGLLKNERGRLKSWDGHFTTGDKNLTTSALKRRQKQILEKSLYSLENDSIEKRSHTAMTMAIDTKKISEAKILIEEFTNKLSSLLETGKKTEVYELHVGLIPLQKKGR